MKILEKIERKGQKYMHDPIKVHPKKRGIIERSVAYALGNKREPQSITIGHKRVKLVWVKRSTTQHDNQNA